MHPIRNECDEQYVVNRSMVMPVMVWHLHESPLKCSSYVETAVTR